MLGGVRHFALETRLDPALRSPHQQPERPSRVLDARGRPNHSFLKMAREILPDGSTSNPTSNPTSGVWLAEQEWREISDCASALFAALKCYDEHHDQAWDLVISVQQRFERALSPINERLSDQLDDSDD